MSQQRINLGQKDITVAATLHPSLHPLESLEHNRTDREDGMKLREADIRSAHGATTIPSSVEESIGTLITARTDQYPSTLALHYPHHHSHMTDTPKLLN